MRSSPEGHERFRLPVDIELICCSELRRISIRRTKTQPHQLTFSHRNVADLEFFASYSRNPLARAIVTKAFLHSFVEQRWVLLHGTHGRRMAKKRKQTVTEKSRHGFQPRGEG